MLLPATRVVLRIELWHVGLLALLAATLTPSRFLDAKAMLLGGAFMGVNFLLLSYGVAWLLAPLASRGRIRAGVALLVLKIVLFMGLLSFVFFRFDLDAISFSIGFSTLLVAILVEAARSAISWRS
jgi:hypothetical protein